MNAEAAPSGAHEIGPPCVHRPRLVSVVIACYNHGRFLAEAIDSALSQDYPNVEVIVVDDGSTDETPSVAAGYGDRIRYVRRANGGAPAAKNTGVRAASGELIAVLDADDRWLPHKLSVQVPLCLKSPRVGLVHSGYRTFGQDGAAAAWQWTPAPSTSLLDLLEDNRVGNLTALFPRRVWDDVGAFDEALPVVEDWDLWIRIAERYEVIATEQVLAEYRVHAAGISRGTGALRRAEMRLLHKHYRRYRTNPYRDVIRASRARVTHRLVQELRQQALATQRAGGYRESLRAYAEAIRLRPSLLLDRPMVMDMLSLCRQAATHRVGGSRPCCSGSEVPPRGGGSGE